VSVIKGYPISAANLWWIPLQIYKFLVVIPMLVLSTLLICSSIILFSALGMQNFSSGVLGTLWARINMLFTLMTIEIHGREKVARGQSYIIVANHQSLVDIYVLYGYLGMDIRWVMKKELRVIPVFGLACEMMGQIIIDRSDTESALASINSARSRIRDGLSVIFFAEGTRSRQGTVKHFKKGAFRLAQEIGIPILPVSIHDTSKVLPSDSLDWHPGHVKLKFHDPIPTTGLTSEDLAALGERTQAVIEQALRSSEP
jgi:1-acyl-sn-glycerol-3-phosphate acyltransferase